MNSLSPSYQPRALPPLVIPDAKAINWQVRTDTLVVGLGGAGVCAALQALENGSDVVAVDRYAGGGATAISGGVVYAGGGSVYQQQACVEDTPEDMFRYLQRETEGVVSDSTLKRFCETSSDNLDWLAHYGVKFGSNLCPLKTSYPAPQYTLYYSGNELLPDYAEVAKPAPRGHRADGVGLSGANFFDPLKKAALKQGMRFYGYSEAKRFVVNNEGEILGVEVSRIPDRPALRKKIEAYNKRYINNIARIVPAYGQRILKTMDGIWDKYGESFYIRADKAVILTTGGFINNREMVDHYAPAYRETMPLGNVGCTGAGIELAQSIGGNVGHMGNVSALRIINPPHSFLKSIVVNAEGLRITAEDCYQAKLGKHIVQENDGRAFLIIDRTLFKNAFVEALPGNGKIFLIQCAPALMSLSFSAKKAPTIEKLAEKCGMNPAILTASVRENNDVAAGNAEDKFKKDPSYHFNIATPPFYAIDISIDRRTFPCPALSLGGLVIDEDSGQVIDDSGRPINKLYAAGRCAVGVPSNGYISGLSIADCVFSGRRAGSSASKAIEKQVQASISDY